MIPCIHLLGMVIQEDMADTKVSGRGAGMYSVGQGYDSLYAPVGYGNPGGYGRYKGNVAWKYTENNY